MCMQREQKTINQEICWKNLCFGIERHCVPADRCDKLQSSSFLFKFAVKTRTVYELGKMLPMLVNVVNCEP